MSFKTSVKSYIYSVKIIIICSTISKLYTIRLLEVYERDSDPHSRVLPTKKKLKATS